ncbi:zinc-binding dehydrogenase [Arthrobacter sp. LAR12-1-1.1]|uniref:zinc-binding dehydrogenase n=1 Tax=Arthrobacter sp. LAR12-1-1.1 TaxID=3135215 RepID=UPI003429DF8C
MNEVDADDSHLHKAVAFISEGLEKRVLTPTIDAVFDLANIADAYRYLASNSQFGKVVVTIPNTVA